MAACLLAGAQLLFTAPAAYSQDAAGPAASHEPGRAPAETQMASPTGPVLLAGSVAGRVTDADEGVGLQGAVVRIEGSGLGTTTGEDGRYRITSVPAGTHTVVARRIGYEAQSRSVNVADNRETTADFELGSADIVLDEVVVTGTVVGATRRSLGNSVATIDADEAVEISGTTDVGSLINGRAPGVIVTPGTGRLGSGPSINIRGRSTLSLSQQPLIYIDGIRVVNDIATGPSVQGGSVISRLNDISPEDIESIEILKGPSAATIYGTEAANGVVQIITKRGVSGRPQLRALVRQGSVWFQDVEGRIPTNYAIGAGGEVLSWNGAQQEAARGTPLFETGHLQTYQLGLSGGSPLLRYYLSSTWDKDRGIEPTNKLSRYTGHANVTVSPHESFDVSSSVNVVSGRTNLGNDYGGSILFTTLYGTPLLEDTPYRGFILGPPEVFREVYVNTQDIARMTGSLTINHRPFSWLSHRLIAGLDQTEEENKGLGKFVDNPDFLQFFTAVDARGFIAIDNRSITYTTADYSATAELPISSGLVSSTSVGGQLYRRRTDLVSALGLEFPGPGLETVAAAATNTAFQDFVTNTTLGAFVQEQLAWQDRIFITGAVRFDNNSAFGNDFDLATYPKLAASWVLSEEPFWNLGWVNTLRLRGAFGASGQQPEAFSALRTFRPTTGPGDLPAVTPQFIGNPELKPERGEELELGFEASLFDRLSVDFTYFNKRTKDAILLRGVPPSGGFVGFQFVNIGETSNRGLELLLDAQVLRGSTLAWDLGLNLGTTRDRIEDLGGLPFISLGLPTQRHVEGYPIGGYWGKRVVDADLDASGVAINLMCDGGPDNDGRVLPCAEAPRVFLGTSTPKLTGAVTTTLTLFGRLRLYGLIDFKRGHKLLDTDGLLRCGIFSACEANVRPENFDPRYVANVQNAGGLAIVDAFVPDASFARLREVSASYSFPEHWASRAGASEATLTVTGRNLHTWTDYPGLDPESRSNIDSIVSFDQAVTPTLAQIITSLSLTF
ncbi:MAG: TonB-dependent receptor domain-containing protein [Gemmatimonadaceae bacterium]